jgi:hypothetical protein
MFMTKLRVLCFAAAVGSVGCGASEQSCERNDQCQRGQACLRPEPVPGTNSPLGSCIDPRGLGGLCYHATDCHEPLACVLPAGGSATIGGSCQAVTR